MAQFMTSCSSVPDASSKLAHRQEVSAVSPVQARIAALEANLPGAVNTTSGAHAPEPDCGKRFRPTLIQNVRPASPRGQSCKPAEAQRGTVSSGPSMPSYLKNLAMPVKANTAVSNETSVSLASAKPAWINYSTRESTVLKPETQESSMPSFPKVHQSTKLSLAQQNRAKPPKLPEWQKPNRLYGTQSNVQWQRTDHSVPKMSLPDVRALGNPPTKPSRPPRVDVQRFRSNRKSLSDGPGMKIPHPVAPPPLRLCPLLSLNVAALSLVVDSCGFRPQGWQDIKAKTLENKQQKATEKRTQEAEKTFMIKGPVHVIKRKNSLIGIKGGKSHSEDIHSTDDHVKTADACHNGGGELGTMSYQPEAESDVYDDIGAPADFCRVSPLPQRTADEFDVYDDVDSQSPPLPSDWYDIYEDIQEDCIYEII